MTSYAIVPKDLHSPWQLATVSAVDAREIVDYASWPNGKPSGAEPVELSEQDKITVFELAGAIHDAFYARRGAKLTAPQKAKLREMLKEALKGTMICDGKLNRLYAVIKI
jgi:hypothetical protein